jgi:hypothetical protein
MTNFDHGIGGSYLVGHGIEKAIDNDSTTWFTTGESVNPDGLRWNCLPSVPKKVVRYTVRQGAYTQNEDPRDFQLRASNDWGKTWTLLDSQVNQSWGFRQKKSFTILNPQDYTLYEFDVLVNEAGQVLGTGCWMSFGEIELLDDQGHDITEDQTGLLTGADESWGNYYPISNVVVDTSAIPVPTTVSLPDTPKNYFRKVFEVHPGTGNDAVEIQKKIDSAAQLPLGSKPVVHFPKATYNIDTTIVIPAEKDMQLVGDGLGSGTITTLNWTGNDTGPMIKCQGPSRIMIKDIWFRIQYHENTGIEGITIEDADQNGGRIYANQFYMGSLDPAHPADMGIYSDGVERSDITVTCTSYGSAKNGVVKARGGTVLAAGGNTNGQISLLTGASGGSQNLFDVSDGGRIDAEGMWYEGYAATNTSGLINLDNTSGKLSITCMQWYLNNTTLPIIRTNNFDGTLTLIDNGFNQVPRTHVRMEGIGTGATFFSGYNYFAGGDTLGVATDSIWQDLTSPNAGSSLLGCVAGSGSHFTYLNSVFDKVHDVIPDTNFILNSLSQMRAVRTEPPMDRAAGVTDVKLFRVASYVSDGNVAAHFISSGNSGIAPVTATSRLDLKIYPDPADVAFTAELHNHRFDLIVYDMTGRKIFERKNVSDKTLIPCKDFPEGIYLVRATTEREEVINKKLFIVRQ